MTRYKGWEKDAQEIAELRAMEVLIERCAGVLSVGMLALAAVLAMG